MPVARVPPLQPQDWSRRAAVGGLFGAVLTGCAAPGPMVNLLQLTPPPSAGASEVLETAFDPASRMTAPVFLDGAGPFPFVVDTGANISVVSAELAQRLQLPQVGSAPVHGIAGVLDAPLVRVRKLSVGQVSSVVDKAPVLPRGRLGVDGLLGMDVLRGRRLTMDFRRERIEIAKSGPRPSAQPMRSMTRADRRNPVFVVPARIRFGQLVIVDAEIAGVRVLAFLDSGSQSTIGNRALLEAVARHNPRFTEGLVRARLISATGQTATGELAAMPPLRLGGLLIGNLVTAFADLHIFDIWGLRDRPAILVGADVMREFNSVEIDYGLRAVTFHPPPEAMTLKAR